MTYGVIRIGGNAYSRADCQLQRKASQKEPELSPSRQQNRRHFLFSLITKRLIVALSFGWFSQCGVSNFRDYLWLGEKSLLT